MTNHDRLIDDAARAMTAELSPVDLRARVIEEIRAGGASLQPGGGTSLEARSIDEAKASYHAWWLAAAAGILLAAYLGWTVWQPIELPTPPALVKNAPNGTLPADWAASSASRPLAATRARQAAVPGAPDPAIASIPALEAPHAIGIAPLDTGPTPVPALDVDAPLEIETLDIKPLVSPPPATGGQ